MCTLYHRWHRHCYHLDLLLMSSPSTTTTRTAYVRRPSADRRDDEDGVTHAANPNRSGLQPSIRGSELMSDYCFSCLLFPQPASRPSTKHTLDQIASHFVTGHTRGHLCFHPIIIECLVGTRGVAELQYTDWVLS